MSGMKNQSGSKRRYLTANGLAGPLPPHPEMLIPFWSDVLEGELGGPGIPRKWQGITLLFVCSCCVGNNLDGLISFVELCCLFLTSEFNHVHFKLLIWLRRSLSSVLTGRVGLEREDPDIKGNNSARIKGDSDYENLAVRKGRGRGYDWALIDRFCLHNQLKSIRTNSTTWICRIELLLGSDWVSAYNQEKHLFSEFEWSIWSIIESIENSAYDTFP